MEKSRNDGKRPYRAEAERDETSRGKTKGESRRGGVGKTPIDKNRMTGKNGFSDTASWLEETPFANC